MTLCLGYNSNGFAHHSLADAIALLHAAGYRAVALTVDHHLLNTHHSGLANQVDYVRSLLDKYNMRCVIETGARFLLDSEVKHEPTFVSPSKEGRKRRLDFLLRCTELAAQLNATCLSFWSGILRDNCSEDEAWNRLVDGIHRLLDVAVPRNVQLAFEPEPGMFIDTMDRFNALSKRVNSRQFGLTLDIGHVHCLEQTPIADVIHQWRDVLWNVHIEDMNRGVHEHLPFGQGTIDFAPVMSALESIGYDGIVGVELSRHSHEFPQQLQSSYQFLSQLGKSVKPSRN